MLMFVGWMVCRLKDQLIDELQTINSSILFSQVATYLPEFEFFQLPPLPYHPSPQIKNTVLPTEIKARS